MGLARARALHRKAKLSLAQPADVAKVKALITKAKALSAAIDALNAQLDGKYTGQFEYSLEQAGARLDSAVDVLLKSLNHMKEE